MIMKNSLKNSIKENSFLIIPFVFMFCLLRVSPMMYDGWAGPYYYLQYGGLINWFFYITGSFRDFINGRVASNYICVFFESFTSEIPLDLIGTLVIVGILICAIYLFDIQKKWLATVLYTSFVVFMPFLLRTYTIQIALLQYMTPIFFLMLMLLLMKQYENNFKSRCVYWLYPLSVLACTWMENTSVAYGIVLVICSLRLMIKERKLDIRLLGAVFVALISGLYMITAPGMTASRITIEGAGQFLSFSAERIYGQVYTIFSSFIYSGNYATASIALVLFISSIMALRIDHKSFQKKDVWKGLLCAYNLFFLIFAVYFGTTVGEFRFIAEIPVDTFFHGHPIITTMIVLLYLFWMPVNIFILCKRYFNQWMIVVYSIVLIFVMLPTNQVGHRIFAPFYLNTSILATYIAVQVFESCKESYRRLFVIVSTFIFVLAADYQLQLCHRIDNVQKERDRRIDLIKAEQYLNGDTGSVYILPLFNERDITTGGSVSMNSFHYGQFLQRYGLLEETKIIFSDSREIFVLSEQSSQDSALIKVVNEKNGNYVYDYIVSYKGNTDSVYVDIIADKGNEEPYFSVEAISGEGYYQVKVAATNLDTGTYTMLDDAIILYLK